MGKERVGPRLSINLQLPTTIFHSTHLQHTPYLYFLGVFGLVWYGFVLGLLTGAFLFPSTLGNTRCSTSTTRGHGTNSTNPFDLALADIRRSSSVTDNMSLHREPARSGPSLRAFLLEFIRENPCTPRCRSPCCDLLLAMRAVGFLVVPPPARM